MSSVATSARALEASSRLGGAPIIEIVASIAPESFGLGYAALNLAAALRRKGANVYLACVDSEPEALQACEEAEFPRQRLICGPIAGPSRFRFSPSLLNRVKETVGSSCGIIHLHGLWTYPSHVAARLRQFWRCPLVVSPHGSLEPYALAISPLKKAAASWLFERRNLMTASCLWALSEQERASIMAYGYPGRIAVLPNGVNRSIECSRQEVAAFRTKHNLGFDSSILLFLSRITPKKNVPLLLRSFAQAVTQHPEWKLVIAGNDEGGHIHEIRRLISDLRLDGSTRLIGPVLGREKACAFSAASLFVLPSYSEGLPIAVLEAMEYGKPVLVTDGWELPVTTSGTYGWRTAVSNESFTRSLLEAMSTPDAFLQTMGREGRLIARESFGWDSVALKANALYESLVCG